jgi:hypothetical protein
LSLVIHGAILAGGEKKNNAERQAGSDIGSGKRHPFRSGLPLGVSSVIAEFLSKASME